jgi:hypothetical protein
MFRVDVKTLHEYFAFDPERRADLEKLDQLIRMAAPQLKRYFHRGTPVGQPGMRFKMIGYGRYHYVASNGTRVEWPTVGVALQKNYISVYFGLKNAGTPVTDSYRGRLRGLRFGKNNFSFKAYEELDTRVLSKLFAEAGRLFASQISRKHN